MSKLPQHASEMTREMRHRELITPSVVRAAEDEARPPVDVLAIITRATDAPS